MPKALLTLMILSWLLNLALGEEASKSYFIIDGRNVLFLSFPAEKLTVDEVCYKNKGNCKAILKLASASTKGLEKEFKGGANRGAVICKKKMFGKLIFAADSRGNQTTFCHFPDGSLIGNGTILFHALKNDKQSGKSDLKF